MNEMLADQKQRLEVNLYFIKGIFRIHLVKFKK